MVMMVRSAMEGDVDDVEMGRLTTFVTCKRWREMMMPESHDKAKVKLSRPVTRSF
jgi:hypothetical protein